MVNVNYIARRMFADCFGTFDEMRLEEEGEVVYKQLSSWFDVYTARYGHVITSQLPKPTADINAMMQRVSGVYDGILSTNKDSLNTIRSMFAASYYMMSSYRSDRNFARLISQYFEEITHDMTSWRLLQRTPCVSSHAV